jgi:hypothetical protein
MWYHVPENTEDGAVLSSSVEAPARKRNRKADA